VKGDEKGRETFFLVIHSMLAGAFSLDTPNHSSYLLSPKNRNTPSKTLACIGLSRYSVLLGRRVPAIRKGVPVSNTSFVDYYELLQLSPNADTETIERVFRHLAKRYHPDNPESADSDRFHLIVEAHRILSDPEARSGYDVKYQDYWNRRWKLASEASDGSAFGDDREVRESLLSILYIQRRRNMKNPGLGDYEMARLLGRPHELVEFHLWYLKSKGWVERLDTGYLAISALGVDEVEKRRLRYAKDRLLTTHGVASEGSGGQAGSDAADLLMPPKGTTLNQ